MKKYLSKKYLALFQAVLIFVWLADLSPLAETDTYYSVFLLCGLAGLAGLLDNWRHPIRRPAALHLFAGVFALLVVMGNYELYQPFYALQSKLNLLMDLVGGFCVGDEILTAMLRLLPLKPCAGERKHPKRFFFLTFGVIAVIDIGYLFAARYPGVLTTDSYTTIAQILNGDYNNTMPFWHTMLVQVFVKLGLALFGEINRAVAFYHVFQLLFVAAIFAYTLMTLYQIGVPQLFLGGVFFVYGLLPYNIVYSVTLWKDIPFGASALLMAVAFYRMLKGIGRRGNWIAFVIGALGVCLLRTNGWFAMLAALAVLALALRRENKLLLAVLTAVLAVSWVLINPVLWLLKVPSTDLAEAFAVPMQQIARVVSNDRELKPEEEALLSEIFDLEKMKELYNPQTVDPVKFETFRYGQKDFFRSHRWEFLKLYLSLGARYPVDYWEAWVEETRGYWNGGYFSAARLKQWRNRVISDGYEPGSTFKVLTMSAALDCGAIDLNTPFHCSGSEQIPGRAQRLHCWRSTGHGAEKTPQALQNSCNIAFAHIALKLGGERFYEYVKNFGVLEKTGIDLAGESKGVFFDKALVTDTDKWGTASLTSGSFGQTFKITPLQLVRAISSVVNGGQLMEPYIVSEILDADGSTVMKAEPTVVRRTISKETSDTMRTLIESVVTEGTAKNAKVAGFSIGGKTGTSEKIDVFDENGQRVQDKIVSFVGIAPMDDPEYIILAALDTPSRTTGIYISGGVMAAPTVGAVMADVLPYLGVKQSFSEDDIAGKQIVMEDLTGMTAKDAQTLLKKEGLTAAISGSGETVTGQIPSPGQTVPGGSQVLLFLGQTPEPETVKVPDFYGMNRQQASDAAGALGLYILVTGNDEISTGVTVTAQNVAKDTEVPAGTTITLVFADTAARD